MRIKKRIKIKKYDHVSRFSTQFFLAHAAFCVLYNRTEHSQDFYICYILNIVRYC